MKFYTVSALTIMFFFGTILSIFGQTSIGVSITNMNNKTFTYSDADLRAMPTATLNIIGEDGAMHNYTGVNIQTLLSKSGIPFGKTVRRQTLNSYALFKAGDNYSVIYALGEIDTLFTDKKIILAWQKDGKSLPTGFGPLQLIATGEKVHARLIRQVTTITVKVADGFSIK